MLPKEILNCEKIIIIPSHSLITRLRKVFQELNIACRDSKLIFDYLIPKIINDKILLLGPILGADGIVHILRTILLNENNKISEVQFYGTAGSLDKEIRIGSIKEPNGFYIENTDGKLEILKSDALNIVSTSLVHLESIDKLKEFKTSHNISLIDMESAFIAKICNEYKVPYKANIIISDNCDCSPKKITQLESFNDFLNIILGSMTLA